METEYEPPTYFQRRTWPEEEKLRCQKHINHWQVSGYKYGGLQELTQGTNGNEDP